MMCVTLLHVCVQWGMSGDSERSKAQTKWLNKTPYRETILTGIGTH